MNSCIGVFEDATQIRGSFLKSLRQPNQTFWAKKCFNSLFSWCTLATLHISSQWKYFKICICCSWCKPDIMTHCSSLPLPFIQNFSKIESTFQRCSGIAWLMVDITVKCFPFAFAYPVIPVLTSVSARISGKTISQKFQGFWAKRFDDAAKYCWFHNGSINLVKNTVKGN